MKESAFIRRYCTPLADMHAALSLMDDAALTNLPASHQLVTTTDMLCADIHFLNDGNPADIAYKSLAANVSDLAAMGAMPKHYQLALTLHPETDNTWCNAFFSGLRDAQADMGIKLSGGDTIRYRNNSHPLIISITATGIVPNGAVLTRSGATQGDDIYVTGTLGDASLYLATHQEAASQHDHALLARYWRPTPRIETGIALRGVATACMDISDGLMTDIYKLCKASHAGATLYLEQLPMSSTMQRCRTNNPERWLNCISAGDDYELLFTAPAHYDMSEISKHTSTPISKIGTVTAPPEIMLLDAHGAPVSLTNEGYEH